MTGSEMEPTEEISSENNLHVYSNHIITLRSSPGAQLFINVTFETRSFSDLYQWKHNGRLISSRTDPRVTILSRGGLAIRDIKPSDRGLYTVTLSNQFRSRSENFMVFIDCKCDVVLRSNLGTSYIIRLFLHCKRILNSFFMELLNSFYLRKSVLIFKNLYY